MRKYLLLFLATASLSLGTLPEANAQRSQKVNTAADPVANLGYAKKLRWADGLFKSGSYYNAVDYYLQLAKEQPRNPYLANQIATSYAKMRDYGNAAHYYGYTYSLASTLYPMAVYDEAINLKMNNQYDEATARFTQFMIDNPKKYKKEKQRAKLEIEGMKMGVQSVAHPEAATVKNLGPNINTGYTEYSPYPLGDTALLYSTQNITQLAVSDKIARADYVSRLKVSKKQHYTDVVDTFQWGINFDDGDFNSDKFHVGNGCFSDGGDRFYFTKCLENDSAEQTCRIFASEFKDTKWGAPVELGSEINVDGTSSTNPFIAKVGKKEILFFASNRKLQGRGGFDLWYSVFDERQKTYRRPQNAGKQINTVGDEKTPYYDSRTNTLYFASNGWKTLGGFDIYSATGGPTRYGPLKNLGYPINTSYDDMGYILDPSGKPDGYLVSNRPGSISIKNPTCCDDIWRVQYEPIVYVRGKVLNSKTQEPVGNVVVKMVDDKGDVRDFNSEDGMFEFQASRDHSYVLNASKQNFTSTRAQFSTLGMKREDPNKTIDLVIYVDSFYLNTGYEMNNVFYDYNKATLRPESGAELEKLIRLLQDNSSLDVTITAYTDSKGTESYNKTLSQERSQSVVNYLISSGVDRSRLTAMGLGETNPAAPNTKLGGKDNPEGRQLNRRTEFKITADQPTKRTIYNSAKKGTIGQQATNLQIDETDQVGENKYDEDATPATGTPATPQTNKGASEMSSDMNGTN